LHDAADEPGDRREEPRAARPGGAADALAAREEQYDHRGDEDRERLLIESREEQRPRTVPAALARMSGASVRR